MICFKNIFWVEVSWMKLGLVHEFKKLFNTEEEVKVFFAPGRVNLIGEHTDYNGGHVFPCALGMGTYVVVGKRADSRIRLFSKNFEELGIIEVDIHGLDYDKEHNWANYPKGIVKILKDAGFEMKTGFNMMFYGNIPNGAGLSSSASIELATCIALKDTFKLNTDMLEMVKLSQKSENEYMGVNCGIMDQFACGMGKKDHAIFLNTNNLNYEYVPIKLDGISIIIANTNKSRGLGDSKYNERRAECERALDAINKEMNISWLCDLTVEEFEKNKHLIQNELEQKRARHVVYENERTTDAVKALNRGNLMLFGALMNASHASLCNDYEVTGFELDTLVSAAWENGAIGSRMTGAGFGGCTVNLVENDKVNGFIDKVGKEYSKKVGYNADFHRVFIGDGARQIVE